MSLGEAFIEVRADLRPFGRDLRRNVKPIVAAFEKELSKALGDVSLSGSQGQKVGQELGNHVSKGLKNSITNNFGKDKNVFIGIAAALGSALDDGISALPTEVKAAIVGGIILAIPVLSALLTGALTAAVGVGVAALGVGLASQFEEVQLAAEITGRGIRTVFVSAAVDFGNAVIDSLALIVARARAMQGLLEDVFALSAPFLDPLTQGLVRGIEELLNSLRRSLGDIRPFIDELGVGITIVFDAIGKSIELLGRSGREGSTALRDLARIIAALIIATSLLLLGFTKLYGIVRDVFLAINQYLGGLSIPLIVIAEFLRATDNASNRMRSFINTNAEARDGIVGLLSATDAETQAIKQFSKALENASDAVKRQLDLNIDWEESLDNIAASIKENGKTLDIRTGKGRANAREFATALQIAEDKVIDLLRRGEINSEQAVTQYNEQIETLRRMGRQAGISEQEFNNLFNEVIEVGKLRISSEEMGINSLTDELGDAGARAQNLWDLLRLISHLSSTIVRGAIGGVRGFAEGDIVTQPTFGVFGEDGPEAVIPLTKPARAAQLLQRSGLDKLLSSSGATQVMVFIGNEQLDARMVRIVQRNNEAQAQSLNHGGRTF